MGMLPFQLRVKFGSDSIKLADPTFECLCLVLSHQNTFLESSGLSSLIIQILFAIVFNYYIYLYSQTQFKCAHGHSGDHTQCHNNPNLAGSWPRHQSSNSPWPSLHIRQSMLSVRSQCLTWGGGWKWGQAYLLLYIKVGKVLHPPRSISYILVVGCVRIQQSRWRKPLLSARW